MSHTPNIGDVAVRYAARGWPVFPCHGIVDGCCTCANPNCSSPGKHPHTAHGVLDATTDAAQVGNWWERWPDANVGIATGDVSGLVVIDIDGAQGEAALVALEERHGKLAPSLTVITGGGRHLYFTYPSGRLVRNSAGVLGRGLDVRADGGYVIGVPSRHKSGSSYTLLMNGQDNPAPLPNWLAGLLCELPAPRQAPNNGNGSGAIHEGERNVRLTSLAGTMRRRGMTPESIEKALLSENQARCEPPLSENEVRRIAASMGRYQPAAATGVGVTVAEQSPTELAQTLAPEWPAPLDDRALIGLGGEVVHALEPHTEADPAAILLQFLALFGNVVGRQAHFRVEGTQHFGNLFVVLVGTSSKGRKGSSFSQVERLFEIVSPEWIKSRVHRGGLSSGEGVIWAVRDPVERAERVSTRGEAPRYEAVVVDPGISDKRLLIMEPEFATVLRVIEREGNTLSAIIRESWDSGVLSSLTKNSPAKATGAHISLIGHVTKEELLRYLTTTEAASGFANRFLFGCVRRSKFLPEGSVVPDETLVSLKLRLAQVIQATERVEVLQRDEQARAIWYEVYPALSSGQPGLVGCVTARAEAQVLRLSMLYALLDGSPVIQERHLLAALALWEYAEASARFIFGDALGDPTADVILRALRGSSSGLTRTEISALFGRHRSAADIDRALRSLGELSLVCSECHQTDGRPVQIWCCIEAAGAKEANYAK